jgi:transcriptional regulator with XRE-family HTH domain
MSGLDKINIGRRIKTIRKREGLTQPELADALGIPLRTLQNYEGGANKPPADFLNFLNTEYGVDPTWILTGKGITPSPIPVSKRINNTLSEIAAAAPWATSDGGAIPTADKPEVPVNIKDLTYKTIEVLESDTIYRTALASNINAFHQSIKMAEELKIMKSRQDAFEQHTKKSIDELAQQIKALQEENLILKQRRSSEEALMTAASSGTDQASNRKTR